MFDERQAVELRRLLGVESFAVDSGVDQVEVALLQAHHNAPCWGSLSFICCLAEKSRDFTVFAGMPSICAMSS